MSGDAPPNEELLRSIVSSMETGVIVWAAGTGALVSCNEAAERIVGCAGTELRGTTIRDPRWEVVGEDGESFPDEALPTLATLRTGCAESGVILGLLRADGARIWLRASSAPVPLSPAGEAAGVVTTFVDITPLREATARYQRARGIAEAMEGANVGTWELNLVTGHAERNPRWAEILGCTLAELPPTFAAFTERIHPDDRPCLAIMETGLRERPPFVYECRARHQRGHWVWVQVRGKVVERDPDGTARRVCGVLVDIEARKRNEESLRASLAENERLVRELQEALLNIKTLEEFLPICMYCKSIRNDEGSWANMETFIEGRSPTTFTHSICPSCLEKNFP
ncbi:MAG TPA: PAS domain S-box protein [Polyangia bacterium]